MTEIKNHFSWANYVKLQGAKKELMQWNRIVLFEATKKINVIGQPFREAENKLSLRCNFVGLSPSFDKPSRRALI